MRITTFTLIFSLLAFRTGAQQTSPQLELARWQARVQLSGAMKGPVKDFIKKSLTKEDRLKAEPFMKDVAEAKVASLQGDGEANLDDNIKLNGMLEAVEEFYNLLADIRDEAHRREKSRKDSSRKSDSRRRALAIRNGTGVRSGGSSTTKQNTSQRLENARRDLSRFISSGVGDFRRGSIGGDKRELEDSLRDSWTAAGAEVLGLVDELTPVIMADAYVRDFITRGLIKSAVRDSTPSKVPSIQLPNESSDPQLIRVVFYDVTDAYDVKRRGLVALYNRTRWILSKQNMSRGGFFELTKVSP